MEKTLGRRRTRSWIALFIALLIAIPGCSAQPEEDPTTSYRSYLSLRQVKASYYTEPKTGLKYPLVQGSLANLGPRTLIVVELTLRFKDNVQRVLYEDHAYPVYVSEFGRPEANKYLKPGEKTRFAFKAPKCPPGWQPGAVDVEITKIVFAKNG
jgi:hypothetical protein